jgi:hypothetical protein
MIMVFVQLKNQLMQVLAFLIVKLKADFDDTAILQMSIDLLDVLGILRSR